jgi:hypothetical protein
MRCAKSATSKKRRIPMSASFYFVNSLLPYFCFLTFRSAPIRRRGHRHRLQILWIAPVIQYSNLLHARHRAPRPTKFLRQIFAVAHFRCVLRQRNSRIPALLRHQCTSPSSQMYK